MTRPNNTSRTASLEPEVDRHEADPTAHVGTYVALARDFLPTNAKAQTFSRMVGNASTNTLVSARLHMVAIYLEAGTVVNSITFVCGTGSAMASATNQWFALFNSSRGKLAVTADDTSTAWSNNTGKTLALTAPFTATYSGLHYLGICVVASTVPTICALTPASSVTLGLAPAIAGSSTTGLTDPASCPATAASLTNNGSIPWAYVS